jgi:hypothetical protein
MAKVTKLPSQDRREIIALLRKLATTLEHGGDVPVMIATAGPGADGATAIDAHASNISPMGMLAMITYQLDMVQKAANHALGNPNLSSADMRQDSKASVMAGAAMFSLQGIAKDAG